MSGDQSNSSALLVLARAAAGGDDAAFDALFSQFRQHLRQCIELRLDPRVRRRVDPSDVLQETQLEVHQRLPDFLERQPMPLRVWLRRTALEHLVRAHERHLKAERRSVVREALLSQRSSFLLAGQSLAKDASPSGQAIQSERARIVSRSVGQLREIDREILIMRNVEGLDFNEIGSSLEITPAAARKRFGRALMRLQKELRTYDIGEHFE